MKTFRFIYQFVLLLMCTTACNEYDDSELWDRVNSLDDRVTSIENQLKALNNGKPPIKYPLSLYL